ncbi:MAG TPA: PQ-loop repeat-containing protein [Burkholderiaceae bacterium]|nr:PQ-loop repeat-containing protein [Burkholderiaceae bacterium]
MATELLGWASSMILLATIGRQVYTQWRTRSTQGVSKWLFVGQITASTGFTAYSFLIGNWVFVVTNLCMLATAVIGQVLYLSNRRRSQRTAPGTGLAGPSGTPTAQ